jgi:hypothetical protein
MAAHEQPGSSLRERRKAAKRAKAERTGDTPEKRRDSEVKRGAAKDTVDQAATRTGIASGGFGGS